jgi:apolipoprotein N-acyltransferase
MPPRLRTTLACTAANCLGLLHALSFAPWNLPWLQVLALAGLFALAQAVAKKPRAAAGLGFCFGLGWFTLGVHWVYISMHSYGFIPAPLAALATVAFAAFLSLYPALALGVTFAAAKPLAARWLLAAPAAWAGSEWLRGWLLTGFPWLASGYAHTDGPLAGFAAVLGIHGVTVLAAFVAGALALAAVGRAGPRRVWVAGLAAAALLLGAGQALRSIVWTQPVGVPISVRLIQGNIPQDTKFTAGSMERIAGTYLRLLNEQKADLVVLPEGVFPIPAQYLPRSLTDALAAFVRERNAALIFGVFLEDPPGEFTNSAVALTPDREEAQRYGKRHLVPFGEFVPWGFRWFVDAMRMPLGDQQRGAPYQPPLEAAGQRIAINICYEDLFGAEIRRAWDDPARAPTLLLNMSNLAWFDDSIALPQHLQISRMRTLETGRPMLRATNSGATAVVDARGNVVAELPFVTEAVLAHEVQGYAGLTPYLRWGDAPALALFVVLAVAGIAAGRRGRP